MTEFDRPESSPNDVPSAKARDFGLYAVVFICGAVVMIYEITGSRILAPFIGTSTYIWTSLIGVILAALSVGYWIGGRMADRRPDVKILAAAIIAAAGLIGLTIVVKDLVLSILAAMPFGLEIKAVLAGVLLFAPASVALGFVTPYAVKLRMNSLGDAGKIVGRLYALSTVGSIAGTFTAGFVMIPLVGSVRTLYIIAAVLVAASLLLVPFAFSRRNASVLLLLGFGVFINEASAYALYRTAGLSDIDTQYSRVQVFRSIDPTTQKPITAMTFDPYSTQSAVFTDSDELVFEYTKFYHLIRAVRPDFQRSLMIGGAGYSFPKAYLSSYPQATLDVVEIDPAMTQIAREHFRLKDDPRLSIFHEDGRAFLNRSESGIYDTVMMDAFGSLFSVPFQLTTREAVEQIHRVLNERGVVVFNLGSAIEGPASSFLQAEFRTYREVFRHVYLFKVRPERPADDLQNLIVVACKAECMPAENTGDGVLDSLFSRRYTAEFPMKLPPLTDELAPVERYSSIAQALAR